MLTYAIIPETTRGMLCDNVYVNNLSVSQSGYYNECPLWNCVFMGYSALWSPRQVWSLLTCSPTFDR
jgi:hypothetical protein